MKKMYKMMIVTLCAVLLVAASVMGTLAYLQMSTQTVTNTFTVGKVEIKLEEYKLKEDGTLSTDKVDVTENNETLSGFKLLPGRIIPKKPVITVSTDSEDCYVFVEIVENLKNYATTNLDKSVWKPVANEENIYYYTGTITKGAEITVFDKVICSANIDKYTEATNLNIQVKAYAVQSEGFADAAAAWNATFGA